MRFGVGKRNVHIPQNMTSLSANGNLVFRTEDDEFYELRDGVAHRYYDPNLGLVNYAGRTFIRTDATSFVRDGTDFFVHLPAEQKFIRRSAIASDESFTEFRFEEQGLWRSDYLTTIRLFAQDERVARSVTVNGEEIFTRTNGEIMKKSGDHFTPYFIDERSTANQFVRIDLEVPYQKGARIVTLFLQPRATPGARKWLAHFSRTQDFTRQISHEGSPFIRNFNTVFYNGEEDLASCVDALATTVQQINSMYESDLEGTTDGKLEVPTTKNIDSAHLNRLHFEFENFGERFKKGGPETRGRIANAYGPFCQLNDQIHACEGALANRHRTLEEAWWSLHCSFLPDLYSELENHMYEEFSLDWDFGTMFMGYHTLGKDILAAFWNDDMDLFHRDEIRPQRISSSEIFLFLGPQSRGHLEQLNRWWDAKEIGQFGFTKNDPRNSIGYIPVADLVCNGASESEIKVMIKGCKSLLGTSLITN